MLNSSLLDHPEREAAVDRLRAFSVADTLGTLLWRLSFNNDSIAHPEAVKELSRRTNEPLNLCALAISEWQDPNCRACGGRAAIKDGEHLVVQCTSCKGTGIRKITDKSRANYLRCSQGQARQYSKRLDRIHKIISIHDIGTNVTMHRELER